jgi:hypothetical protein
MVTAEYYDTIIERLRERLGERAETLITLCYDANGLDYESGKHRERNREEEPYVGDMIANTVYAIITGIDGRHQAELDDRVAERLHDELCNDGDTRTCGRWRCGTDPASRFHSLHAGHVDFYRQMALGNTSNEDQGFVEVITPGAFDKTVGDGVDVPVTYDFGPVVGTAHVTKEEPQ